MVIWAYVLLTVDMALMGGILYILIAGRGLKKSVQPDTYAPAVVEEAELERLQADVEKSHSLIDAYERSFEEKDRRFEAIVRRAEESARSLEALYQIQGKDEVYAKAMGLLKAGASAEEVVKDLGLMSGEAELIEAISSYRV